jgi:serine/threonine protein kinase
MSRRPWRQLRCGARLDGYRITERIGAGNYAEVWKAEPLPIGIGEPVAVKSFARLGQIVRKDKLAREILREALAQSQIRDRHVVRIHRGMLEEGCLMLEYCEGSLEEYIRKKQMMVPFSLEKCVEVVKGCLEGLKAIHSRQIVHGDIKPANILLGGGDYKISDFGVASILYKKKFPPLFFQGSSTWAAPEVLKGEKPTYQSDLFSLGVVFYLLLTGRHPFYNNDPTCLSGPEHLAESQEFVPTSAYQVEPSVPRDVSDIVDKLLAREPSKRYRSVDEVLISLSTLGAPPIVAVAGEAGVPELERKESLCLQEARKQYFVEYKPRAAVQTLQRCISDIGTTRERSIADLYQFQGFILNGIRDWAQAEKAATIGLDLDPQRADLYMTRAYAKLSRGKEKKYNSKLAKPNSKEARYLEIAARIDLEGAIHDLKKGLECNADETKRSQLETYLKEAEYHLAGLPSLT